MTAIIWFMLGASGFFGAAVWLGMEGALMAQRGDLTMAALYIIAVICAGFCGSVCWGLMCEKIEGDDNAQE